VRGEPEKKAMQLVLGGVARLPDTLFSLEKSFIALVPFVMLLSCLLVSCLFASLIGLTTISFARKQKKSIKFLGTDVV
jgi:hypothetical protein